MAVHDMLMAAGGSSAGTANWVDDVFSTYLYTGNGSTQTITNGIDLSTKGGLVWGKNRTAVGSFVGHYLADSARTNGIDETLKTNTTAAQTSTTAYTSFNTNGFSVGATDYMNTNTGSYVTWTFRKQPKFFDIVTYTGTGSSTQTITHNLGSTPGCIIVKRTDATGSWTVYHRGLTSDTYRIILNTTAAEVDVGTSWNVTSTTFDAKSANGLTTNGATYVAYLFAHNAGGFGTAGTDNVISCGSFTSATSTITLGYEPQWILFKATNGVGDWRLVDNMRGLPVSGNPQELYPNTSGAESSNGGVNITSTGFTQGMNNYDYIYIAIRRPMKPPTTGTEVFTPIAYTGNATANTLRTAGFPVDMVWGLNRDGNSNKVSYDRLRGAARRLAISSTAGETSEISSQEGVLGFDSNVGYRAGQDQGAGAINFSGWTYGNAMFRRAPGFFDVVCYTGTGSVLTLNHNLTVAPELIILKQRNVVADWPVATNFTSTTNLQLLLNSNTTIGTYNYNNADWYASQPTATQFVLGGGVDGVNVSGRTYVAYLFATCAGVSKVGSYTGTGTTQQINCGFSGGARFVLIKRTDSTGDWYVWDTARGIVSGNDPYLLMNSTAAEVTSTDYIDPYSAGFEISSTAPAAINANGGSYIYLAIA